MSHTRLIALPCKISAGIVPDERAFEVKLYGGATHSGVAPVHYFWNAQGNQLAAHEPTDGNEIPGRIAARLLERQNGTALVSIPDGAVIPVASDAITNRPSEVTFHVSVGPRS